MLYQRHVKSRCRCKVELTEKFIIFNFASNFSTYYKMVRVRSVKTKLPSMKCSFWALFKIRICEIKKLLQNNVCICKNQPETSTVAMISNWQNTCKTLPIPLPLNILSSCRRRSRSQSTTNHRSWTRVIYKSIKPTDKPKNLCVFRVKYTFLLYYIYRYIFFVIAHRNMFINVYMLLKLLEIFNDC